MADTDVLPSRGVPRMALVDSTGVATNGSSTIAQLAAKGIQSICAVDATGVSVGGPNVAQLASAGIRSFCPVDENGVAQDSSTAIQLQTRGIRPMVLLGNTGIALTGSSDMPTLARKGLGYFCPVDESGNATTMGPVVLLSNATVQDNITVGSLVGTLSVAGGSGTYTFTLTSNPGSHFVLAGTNGVNLNTATAMTVGTYPITVQAAGGVPTPVTRTFAITVIPSPVAPVNTVLPVISGSTVVGNTLTTTSGTWTGFPAPGFTYQWQRDTATGDPDVTAWVAAVTAAGGTVSGARNTAVTTFITALKTAGVWATLDRYWLLAGEDAGSAKVDMVARASLTVTGTPVFTASKGYVTSSGNNVTAFTPSTDGVHHTQNSATLGAFVNTDRTTGASIFEFGCSDAAFTKISSLNAWNATYAEAAINNSSTHFGVDKNHGARGSWTITRTASTVGAGYYNGSSAGYPNGGFPSGTVPASTGLPDAPFAIGAFNQGGTFSDWSGDQISSFYAGGAWDDAKALAFYNAESALMTSIGVLP